MSAVRMPDPVHNPDAELPLSFRYRIHRRKYIRSHTRVNHRAVENGHDYCVVHIPVQLPGVKP